MNAAPSTLVLLVVSVLALLGGPIAMVVWMYSPVGFGGGAAVALLGAAGLWIGMRRLGP